MEQKSLIFLFFCPMCSYDWLYLCVLQAGGSSGLLMDLAANEKAVHSDFFNGKAVPFLHHEPVS